jgi:hypothetical protein
MRSDIQKVVCERQRGGSRERSLKTGLRLNPKNFNNRHHRHTHFEDFRDDLLDVCDQHPEQDDVIGGVDYGSFDWGPSRLPIARRREYGWDCKRHSENWNPMQRFLRKQVGRPWNDVYSEICTHLDHRSRQDSNVLKSIGWTVAQDIMMHDGKPYQVRWGRRDSWWRYPYSGLYVHPETGVLCEFKREEYVRPPAPVESIHWFGNTWFVLETFKDKNTECGCVHFKVPPIPENKANKRYYRRYEDRPAVCVHGNEPTPRPIWYVYEFGYHDPNEVYRVVHSWDRASSRFALAPDNEPRKIYYRDVPDILAKPYLLRKKVANHKELKLIHNYIAEGGVNNPSPDPLPTKRWW